MNQREKLDADLVGITAMTCVAPRAYEIADILMDRGIPVVMGGVHASELPQEALKHVSSVVVGEAEETWPKVVNDVVGGKLKKIYRFERRSDLRGLPQPRRDLLREDYLFPYSPVQTSRGCPFKCDFCSVHKFFGGKYRTRPVADVINEIREMRKDLISFVDDNIVGNPRHAKELFKALIPLKINWFGQASISIAKDEELLKLAADSGCDVLLIGFESVSQDSLNEMKKVNKLHEYPKLIKKIQDYGIEILGCFVFGFDSDKKDVFQKTLDFCDKNNIKFRQFTILTPLPGTDLFNKMKKEGRILTYDWEQYMFGRCVFKPKNMTAQELEDGQQGIYKESYSWASVIKMIIGYTIKHRKFLKFLGRLNYIPEIMSVVPK